MVRFATKTCLTVAAMLLIASCGTRQNKHGSPMVSSDIVEEIPEQVIAADTVATVVDSALAKSNQLLSIRAI